MTNPRIVLWPLAFFPWIDYFIRFLGDYHRLHPLLGPLWDDLFLVLCLGFVLVGMLDGLRFPALPAPILWSLLALVSTCVLSILLNGVPLKIGIDALRVTFQPMLFALITMTLLQDGELLDEFVDVTIVSGVLIALFGLGQYVLQIESWRWIDKPYFEQFRIVSIFANPNALAGYLNMVLALSLSRALFGGAGARRKVMCSIASLALVGALVVTFSRGAWAACVALCLLYATAMKKRWLVGALALAAIGLFVMSHDFAGRVTELLDPAYYKQSAHFGRLAFWSKALDTIRENPLFGAGMGMVGGSLSIRHHVPGATWIDNHYLKMGAEIGLVGLLSFAALLSALFIRCRKVFRRAASDRDKAISLGISGVILVTAIQNVTASIWEALYVGVHFYAFVGILFALQGSLATEAAGAP